MSEIKAEKILPKELIEAIQMYVSGESIYIPCKEKKGWGSQTSTKQYYKSRNSEILDKYEGGFSVTKLAEMFSLSEKTIYRIIKSGG